MSDTIRKLLVFQCGETHFGVEYSHVIKVIPSVSLSDDNGLPENVRGWLNYHGTTIPVLDFSKVMTGKESPGHLSTRIIVTKWEEDGADFMAGIMAEQAVNFIEAPAGDFSPHAGSDAEPFLAEDVTCNGRKIQVVVPGAIPGSNSTPSE